MAIISADEPFQRLFGVRTGSSTIADLISPSIAGDIGQRLAALTPSAPETRIPEERGEWKVYGLFDDEGRLSELEWSWQAPGGRSTDQSVQHPAQNEEALILREDKNGMIQSVEGAELYMAGGAPGELPGTEILSLVAPADIPGPSGHHLRPVPFSGVHMPPLSPGIRRRGTPVPRSDLLCERQRRGV
jgi:hypothetical protein